MHVFLCDFHWQTGNELDDQTANELDDLMEKAILENKPEFVKFFVKRNNGIRLCDFFTHERVLKFDEKVSTANLRRPHTKLRCSML